MKKKISYHHGNLEDALLTAGIKEARETGIRNLGVTHLANLVNVSPMAVYRHFPNGESLKAGISQQAREELARQMLKALGNEKDIKKRFLAIGRAYIEFGIKEPGLFSVAFLDCDAEPSHEDNPSSWLIFQDAILDLCNDGLIDHTEIEQVAAFAWSLVHGYVTLANSSLILRPKSEKTFIDQMLERSWLAITKFSERDSN